MMDLESILGTLNLGYKSITHILYISHPANLPTGRWEETAELRGTNTDTGRTPKTSDRQYSNVGLSVNN